MELFAPRLECRIRKRDGTEEVLEWAPEETCQQGNVDQTEIPLPSLDRPDVGPVQPCLLRKIFL